MSRTFYTEYVRHALRFFTRNYKKPANFKSEADARNWMACHTVLKNYTDKELDALISIYSGYDTLPDEVYNASKKLNIDQNILWDLMKEVERKIARRRGLM